MRSWEDGRGREGTHRILAHRANPDEAANGRDVQRGRMCDMTMIADRLPEAADRAVPGHWEGDLIIGKNGKSAIGTLVERRSRFIMLLPLPLGRSAENVRQALTLEVQKLPQELPRNLTWDQGKEMAEHAQFAVDTNVKVFFCDPHRAWQRGSNENTNGLLRQYFPQGADLNAFSHSELAAVANELNWSASTEHRLDETI